ncbi:exonuclease subunit SbcD, partial [Klebsiella pneumoniae]|nr:exonuclease subunit SbcD [Klebsiella pneumoniae]
LLVRRSREQREKILLNAQRETLSELKVEEVFERRLALTEIDEMKRARLHELFAHTVHKLTAEDENA